MWWNASSKLQADGSPRNLHTPCLVPRLSVWSNFEDSLAIISIGLQNREADVRMDIFADICMCGSDTTTQIGFGRLSQKSVQSGPLHLTHISDYSELLMPICVTWFLYCTAFILQSQSSLQQKSMP